MAGSTDEGWTPGLSERGPRGECLAGVGVLAGFLFDSPTDSPSVPVALLPETEVRGHRHNPHRSVLAMIIHPLMIRPQREC